MNSATVESGAYVHPRASSLLDAGTTPAPPAGQQGAPSGSQRADLLPLWSQPAPQRDLVPDVLFLRVRNAMTTQKYRQGSRTLLAQARSELAIGDVRQVSEKGWGAAALMLKAIAEQRGWEHGKHRHLSRVASRLRAETGDRDIYRWSRWPMPATATSTKTRRRPRTSTTP